MSSLEYYEILKEQVQGQIELMEERALTSHRYPVERLRFTTGIWK
jgi:hypothetical protein